jgi:hypothetical protein
MQNYDRSTKILLFLLVLGVWGLLLRPLFPSLVTHAQKAQPKPQPQASTKAYGILLLDEKQGWNVNGSGTGSLVTTGLIGGLQQLPSGGWKLHSVVPGANGTGYSIIVEK